MVIAASQKIDEFIVKARLEKPGLAATPRAPSQMTEDRRQSYFRHEAPVTDCPLFSVI
jgi:hypothetical protein